MMLWRLFLMGLVGMVVLSLLTGAGDVLAKKRGDRFVESVRTFNKDTSDLPPTQFGGLFVSAQVDTFVLGVWNFDDNGLPDPQGWVSHDATADGLFFHVDDFSGLADYAPLEGSQSLWCGARPDAEPFMCTWATLPGYGNYWSQIFESVPFEHEGAVTISYKVKWDCEPALLDGTRLQYMNKDSVWTDLPVNDGREIYDYIGELFESFTVPDSAITSTVRFRFFFYSDGGWSDEDGDWPTNGAIIVDSLTVMDTMGVIDFQDFELEPPGVTATLDGDWYARELDVYGDYAALFDGTTVLQEDPADTNTTWLWGFFNESPYDYACGGHPEQAVVPFGMKLEEDWVVPTYMANEIWSPPVDLLRDHTGDPIVGTPLATYLEVDVYKDLLPANLVCYRFHVRSIVDGCGQNWRVDSGCIAGEEPVWVHEIYAIDHLIDSAATVIQVKVEVLDLAGYYGPSECHSHGPLFDNVRITRVFDTATGIHDVAAPGILLDQNVPNPFNPCTSIRYSIEEAGHVNLTIYDVTGGRVRTLVDASLEPLAGGHSAVWDGKDDRGRPVSSGVYFYRLRTANFEKTKKMILLK